MLNLLRKKRCRECHKKTKKLSSLGLCKECDDAEKKISDATDDFIRQANALEAFGIPGYSGLSTAKIGAFNANQLDAKEESFFNNTNAKYFLEQAVAEMKDRESTYDAPGGERSMEKTVKMFNALCDKGLTTEQGWLFMQILKMVRCQQGDFKADNYTDGAAYMALAGETAAVDRKEKK